MAYGQYIFVDDSGDPSFGANASRFFVMSAVVFNEGDEATKAKEILSNYRSSIGWQENHEFKFSKSPKKFILELLKLIHKVDFQVYAIFINKQAYRQIFPVINDEKLYNWAIKELLSDINAISAKITIDGRSGKQYMRKTSSYLRKSNRNSREGKISIKFGHSDKIDLLQLADIIAGSINRAQQSDKTDSQRYLDIFKDRIIELRQINFR